MDKFSWSETQSQTAFPVAKAGYPFIIAGAFTTSVFAFLEFTVLAIFGLVVTFFLAFFFRDPDRIIPNSKAQVVSPADGKVVAVESIDSSPYYEGTCQKISVFMSVFNVHVNRIPYAGKVQRISYRPGKFFVAHLDKASKDNERNAIFLKTKEGKTICTVQIAGLVARRIICKLKEGDTMARGQRFGMICFGSRVDVYLPSDFKPEIAVGDEVKAGTSILGELS
jgi:phosphatidylserine decarboxylase